MCRSRGLPLPLLVSYVGSDAAGAALVADVASFGMTTCGIMRGQPGGDGSQPQQSASWQQRQHDKDCVFPPSLQREGRGAQPLACPAEGTCSGVDNRPLASRQQCMCSASSQQPGGSACSTCSNASRQLSGAGNNSAGNNRHSREQSVAEISASVCIVFDAKGEARARLQYRLHSLLIPNILSRKRRKSNVESRKVQTHHDGLVVLFHISSHHQC